MKSGQSALAKAESQQLGLTRGLICVQYPVISKVVYNRLNSLISYL